MLELDYYGVARLPNGVGLLVQETGISNALNLAIGSDIKPAFNHWWQKCPHQIDLDDVAKGDLPDDPLIEVFLPVPNPGPVVFLTDNGSNRLLVQKLLRLSSPTRHASLQLLWTDPKEYLLQTTNIQPLVVLGYSPNLHSRMQRLVDTAPFQPRRLVVMLPDFLAINREGYMDPGFTERDLPPELEKIGAHRLREHLLTAPV